MSRMGTETNMPRRWNNIFQGKKADAVAYLTLYGFLPVLMSFFSLQTHGDQLTAMAYCYFSIFISAVGCIYDGCNRWEHGIPCTKNTKLGVIIVCTAIVAGYSLFVALAILCLGKPIQWDYILLLYAIPVLTALIDLCACFLRDMVIRSHITGCQ